MPAIDGGALGGIGLADVWPILREICHDVALYVGGGAIVGGAIGGGLGVFAFAAGALPGAAAGAALGAQAGNLLLGFFGLKSVVVFMLDSLPRATRAYRQGFFEAWGGMPDLGAYSQDAPHYGVDRLADSTYLAARAFARGHEILILALLAGVVAYLTIGKGQLPALLAEVRQSARMGPKMASWLEQNEGELLNHPLLNERARGNGGGATGGGAEAGASASGPRTGNQTTTGAARRGVVQAVGEAERKALLEASSAVPHGFASADEFVQFGRDMRAGLSRAGFGNVEPLLQGSAITGKSFKTGQPFDVGRVSDLDVALADRALLAKAEELGIGLRSGGTRTGPLTARDLRALGLRDLSNKMGQQVGREVNFMIYNNPATAAQRAPSIILPGRK